jgi:predicted cobalt transporter CbtA
MLCTTMEAIDGLRLVLGVAQLLIGAVAIGLVLRGRRRSPGGPDDFRGGSGWAVAGWAVFGLLGLVWIVLTLRG